MSSDKRMYVVAVLAGGLLLLLFFFYLNPELLMTGAAKGLKEKDLVEAQNDVRGDILSVGAAVFILGTLLVNIVQTAISQQNLNATLQKLEEEKKTARENLNLAINRFNLESERVYHKKQMDWKNKVEPAYVEWAEAFLSGTRQGIYVVRNRVNGDSRKKEEAKREHSVCHFIREKAVLRILMFEQLKPVLEKFKDINKYPYPHYPITENLDDSNKKREAETIFWNNAARNEKIIGHFYGVTKERLTGFCDWISDPNDELEIPSFHNYLEVVKTEIPDLKSIIETIRMS